MDRRQFLKLGMAGTALMFVTYKGGVRNVAYAAIPGGTLDPTTVSKFVSPLVIPPAMPQTDIISTPNGEIDYYEIAMRQLNQRILPDPWPVTRVWSYCSLVNPSRTLNNAGNLARANINAAGIPGTLNYPAFTIEARNGRPVRVKWVNELVNASGRYLRHLLPVDPTLHWANPPGGRAERDIRPTFTSTPESYRGPVPMVPHLHGAEEVTDESDGYTEAWFLPDAANIPARYAKTGTWYAAFRDKFKQRHATGHHSDDWAPGSATFQYPNSQRASSLWYHDHTLGMTRLNVYAGPAGFYFVRGGADDVVKTQAGGPATLPGPAPQQGDGGGPYYEIPIVVQDRSFDNDGQLFYPDTRQFFDGVAGPYIPDGEFAPIWNPEFFGNTMVVNGVAWPYLEVEPRRYRFRLLNGCQSRFLILKFDTPVDADGNPIMGGNGGAAQPYQVPVWQIGNEAGFLSAPVDMNAANNGELLMTLADRADVIVDFGGLPPGTKVTLLNLGPDAPFGGEPIDPADLADPESTGKVMQFVVSLPLSGADTSTPPQDLVLPRIPTITGIQTTREVALLEEMGEGVDASGAPVEGPVAALLGVIENGVPTRKLWMEPITENPGVGDAEVWQIYNLTGDAHPIHIHEQFFQLVNRRELVKDANGDVRIPIRLGPTSTIRDPEPWEKGWLDTVIAYPGEKTRIRIKFNNPGLFVWHCHIVEHEDNEMMRPYAVGPIPEPMPVANGKIKIEHGHNKAELTYINVGGLNGQDEVKPASGLGRIVGRGLIIDPVRGVSEVGGGEGYGVNGPSDSSYKQIDGREELHFFLAPALQQTVMTDASCRFRLDIGGSAEVIVEARLGDRVIETFTRAVSAAPGDRFTDPETFTPRRPFDRLVFKAGPGSAYSVVHDFVINTHTV